MSELVSITTTNGTEYFNSKVIDGRTWIQIPFGSSTTTNGNKDGSYVINPNFTSLHTYGAVTNTTYPLTTIIDSSTYKIGVVTRSHGSGQAAYTIMFNLDISFDAFEIDTMTVYGYGGPDWGSNVGYGGSGSLCAMDGKTSTSLTDYRIHYANGSTTSYTSHADMVGFIFPYNNQHMKCYSPWANSGATTGRDPERGNATVEIDTESVAATELNMYTKEFGLHHSLSYNGEYYTIQSGYLWLRVHQDHLVKTVDATGSLSNIKYGTYTYNMYLSDASGYYIGGPFTSTVTVEQPTNDIYSNNLVNAVYSYNNNDTSIINARTTLNVDTSTYPLSYATYDLSGINNSNTYSNTITTDASNIKLDISNVSIGTYSIRVALYDASGFYIAPIYQNNHTFTLPTATSGVISNTSYSINYFTNTIAGVNVSFDVDTSTYDYYSVHVLVDGTDISGTYTGSSSSPSISLDSLPLGSNTLKVTFKDQYGFYLVPTQTTSINVQTPTYDYINSISFNTTQSNSTINNGTVTLDLSSNVNITDLSYISFTNTDGTNTNGPDKIFAADISNTSNIYQFTKNNIYYNTNQCTISFVNNSGYFITPSQTVSLTVYPKYVNASLDNGIITITDSEGTTYADTAIVTPSTTAKLNGTNLEDITIQSNGRTVKIIEKIGNTYYLKQNVTWYEIDQVSNTAHYIQLYDGETFDGNGFTIDLVTSSISGLFYLVPSSIDNPCTVKNLGVLNGLLYADYDAYLIKRNSYNFIVDTCYSTGPINKRRAGGLIGSACGYGIGKSFIVRNSYTTGDMVLQNQCGGICSINCGSYYGKAEIYNCYTTGEIGNLNSGGIAANDCGTSGGTIIIKNCIAYGNITYSNCGGIAGTYSGAYSGGSAIIQNCYYAGSISSNVGNSGGIVAYQGGINTGFLIVQNCYSTIEPYNTNGSITSGNTDTNELGYAYQLNYGNSTSILDIDSYDDSNQTTPQTYLPNYNISSVNQALDKINNSTTYTNGTSYTNANHPIFTSSTSTVTNSGNAYTTSTDYPILKSFIDSSVWNTSNYTSYTAQPVLAISSVTPTITNLVSGGCDIQFDLTLPSNLYTSITNITVEALNTDLSNSYDVTLTDPSATVLLTDVSYTGYNVVIKFFGSDGLYIIDPHKIFVLPIKPDGVSVPDVNQTIVQGTTDPITLTLTSTNPNGVDIEFGLVSTDMSYGTVSLSGSTLTYTPDGTSYGTETILYYSNEVGSSLTSENGTISILIDAIPISENKYVNINQGASSSIIIPAQDPLGSSFTTTITQQPTKGSVTKVNNTTFTYVHNNTDLGEDIIAYTLTDALSTSTTYYIYVQINSADNNLPVAFDGSYDCQRNQYVDILLTSTDSNADRSSFVITQRPTYGTLNKYSGVMTMNLNRNYEATVRFFASQSFSGTETIKYTIYDGLVKGAEGTITINCINSAPTATDLSINILQNEISQFELRGVDLNSDSLVYTINNPSNGTITNTSGKYVTYQPNQDFTGTDTFTYTVSDGSVSSNSATVSINVENAQQKDAEVDGNIDTNLGGLPERKRKKIKDDIKDKILRYTMFNNLVGNYTQLIYNYRKGGEVDVSNATNDGNEKLSITTDIKKQVRTEMRRQLNSFGYDNLRISSTEQKNNILNAANSVADVNPSVLEKEIVSLIPNPDTMAAGQTPNYDLNQVKLEDQNIYFDITNGESISLTFGDYTKEFTYIVETDANDNITDDYLQDASSNVYRAGDNIIIGNKTMFIVGLGSVIAADGDFTASSGDPYINTLTKKTYKMKEQPGIYRMFEGNNITVNAQVDWISQAQKDKILNYFTGLENVVTKGILYNYLYINNEGEKLVVDFINRKLHTNDNNKSISIGKTYTDYSKSQFYKSIKCSKIPITITNKHHGTILFTVELYDNPQIDSGLSISVEKYKLNNITGLLADTYKENDMKLSSLDDLITLKHNNYSIEDKKHIIEKHEAWYYFKK